MARKIGQITNADVYLDGDNVLKGRVAEFDMGEIGSTEVEHKTLGMIGVLKLPGRPVEAIEGKITFEWLDEEVERLLINPTKRHNIQLHSYVDVFDEEGLNVEKSLTLVTHVGFMTMKSGGKSAKLGETMGVEHTITVPTFMQKVYGDATPIVEFDAWNGIYNVNGEPVWWV
ncbi:MAG: phage major tail tube protein [Hyphomicrobiales bacterium]|nr:phage major tail tube protein [Hyphomicrobiales bacterium]